MLCKKRAAVFCTRAEENRERYKSRVHHSDIFASGFAQPSAAGATATSACEYSHWVHRIAGNGAEQYVGPRHVIAELLYDDRKCEHCQKHKQGTSYGTSGAYSFKASENQLPVIVMPTFPVING